MKLLVSNVALASRNAKLPYLAWCYRDTSLKRLQGQHWVTYACRSVIVTSDARALTSSFTKTCVNWNNRTKEARPEDFVPNSGRYYFRRDWERGEFYATGKKTSCQGMMILMSTNWTVVATAHICWSDGFLSCDKTADHVKECYLSASIKDWSHSQICLGENIFLPLSAPL